jgi:regulator of cell morphogenesis and NO signaling
MLEQDRLLYAVLDELQYFERELALHCAIEDNIMLPAMSNKSEEESKHKEESIEKGEELSNCEKDVLIKIVEGLSNKEIADSLYLSTHTVMSHRKNIARKLNIHSIAGLTIYAIVNGIVNLDDVAESPTI